MSSNTRHIWTSLPTATLRDWSSDERLDIGKVYRSSNTILANALPLRHVRILLPTLKNWSSDEKLDTGSPERRRALTMVRTVRKAHLTRSAAAARRRISSRIARCHAFSFFRRSWIHRTSWKSGAQGSSAELLMEGVWGHENFRVRERPG